MKKAATVLLIVLSLLIGFQRILIVLHYQFNWERIEQKFCENKDSIIITCKGICYVQKAFQQSQDKGSASTKIVYQKADVIFEIFHLIDNTILEIPMVNQAPPYLDIIYLNPFIEVFVPPPLY